MSTDDEVRDTDPTGRYIRFDDELGRGAYKVVYRAIDRDRGIEVAWNQIRVDQQADFEKLWKEITILQSLSHPNILVCHAAWVDEKQLHVAFITECMTSGTIRQFMKKAKSVKLKVVKGWCTQILEGLNYLHTRNPPIIHRDIKCDNILINGTSGIVKIGDLGLATNILNYTGTKLSIIGTPEFMAPEYYEEVYDEKVDIWAFGMCLLEMATLEYPFSECTNPAQIFKKVSSGQKPRSLLKLKDADILQFLDECLAPAHTRKSAAELLQHPFLQNLDDDRILTLRSDEEVDEILRSGLIAPTHISSPSAPLSPTDTRLANLGINGGTGGLHLSNQPPLMEMPRGANVVSTSPPPMSSAPIAIPGRKEITNHMEYTTSSLTKVPRSEVSTMSSSITDSDRSHSLDSPPMSMTSALPDPHAMLHHTLQHTHIPPVHTHSPLASSTSAITLSGGHIHAVSTHPIPNPLAHHNHISAASPSITPGSPSRGNNNPSQNQVVGGVVGGVPGVMSTMSSPPHHQTHPQQTHLQQTHLQQTHPHHQSQPQQSHPHHQQTQVHQTHSLPPSYTATDPDSLHYGSSPPVAYPTMVPPVHLGPGQGDMIITVLNSPQSNADPMIVSLQLAFGATGTVEFDFRIDTDTALAVAREMSDEFQLSPSLLSIIAQYISDKVVEYIQVLHPNLGITRTPDLDIPLSQQRADSISLIPPSGSPRHGPGSSPRRFVSNMNLDKSMLSQLVGSREIPMDKISGTSPRVASPTMGGHDPNGHHHVVTSVVLPVASPPSTYLQTPPIHHIPVHTRGYRQNLDNELESFDDMSIPSPRRMAAQQNVLKKSFSSTESGGSSPNPMSPGAANLFAGTQTFSDTRQQPQELGFNVGPWGSMATDPISRAARNRSASAAVPRRPAATAIPAPDYFSHHPSQFSQDPTLRPFDDMALRSDSPKRPTADDHRAPHFGSILHEISADMHNNSRNFENALRDFEHHPSQSTQSTSSSTISPPDPTLDTHPFHSHHSDSDTEEDDDEYDEEPANPPAAHRSSPIGISSSPSPFASSHTSPALSASMDRVMSMSTPFGDVMITAPVTSAVQSSPSSSGISSPNRGSLALTPNQLFADQHFSSN